MHRLSVGESMAMKKSDRRTTNPIKILTTTLFCSSQHMTSGIGGGVGENSGGENAGSIGIPSADAIVAATFLSRCFVGLSLTGVSRFPQDMMLEQRRSYSYGG
jgi:hypothetical protein